MRRVKPSLLAILFLSLSVRMAGLFIGKCPTNPPRKSSQKIQELQGVVVDENLAVIPKVAVKLQVPDGRNFRDLESVETDLIGRFGFAG